MSDVKTAHGACGRALAWFRRPRGVESTPSAWALLPSTAVRIAELEELATARSKPCRVLIDPHFVPRECEWPVHERPPMATVRVIGVPADDDTTGPLLEAMVCHGCATNSRSGPVVQALCEAAPGRVAQVEVIES